MEYVKKMISQEYNRIDIWFYNETDKVFEIGEKMCEINSEAYMNGYNWSAFFNYYLSKHAPAILAAIDQNPEAGSYVAFMEHTLENEVLADKFVDIIKDLIENEEKLYKIVEEEGNEIEWD